MDGLIPMVYKSLKKSKTRRKYQCLSSPTQPPLNQLYNIADFYTIGDHRNQHPGYGFSRKHNDPGIGPVSDKIWGLHGARHRRSNSVHVAGVGGMGGYGFEEDDRTVAAAKPKQLVRFRSHRMFSCVGGA